MKAYSEMTNDEIVVAVRHLVKTSKSDDEIRHRIREELGYPHFLHLDTTWCGEGALALIMMLGPDGRGISIAAP